MSKSKNMLRILKVSCGMGKENNKYTITVDQIFFLNTLNGR